MPSHAARARNPNLGIGVLLQVSLDNCSLTATSYKSCCRIRNSESGPAHINNSERRAAGASSGGASSGFTLDFTYLLAPAT